MVWWYILVLMFSTTFWLRGHYGGPRNYFLSKCLLVQGIFLQGVFLFSQFLQNCCFDCKDKIMSCGHFLFLKGFLCSGKSNQKILSLMDLLKSTPCWPTSAKLYHWGHSMYGLGCRNVGFYMLNLFKSNLMVYRILCL